VGGFRLAGRGEAQCIGAEQLQQSLGQATAAEAVLSTPARKNSIQASQSPC
jgi:hypothetical protein